MKVKQTIIISALILSLACVSSAAGIQGIQPTITAPVTRTLDTSQSEYDEPIRTPSYTWTVTAETLYIRAGPGMSYAAIGSLAKGEILTVHEWSKTGNGWAMIAPAQWVNGDYIKLR